MLMKIIIVIALIVVAYFGWQAISKVIVWDQGSFQAKTNSLDRARERDVDEVGKKLKSFAANNSGSFPASVDILINQGYVTALPLEPAGGSYDYWVSDSRKSATYLARLETNNIYCWGSFNGSRQVETSDDCQP